MKKFYFKLEKIEGIVEANNMFDVILYLADTYYLESLDYISLIKDEDLSELESENILKTK